MKNLKKLLLIAFLGTLSIHLRAEPCSCSDYAIFNGLNVPFMYGLSQANFNGGFNFVTCNEGTVTFTWDFGDGTTYTHTDNGTYNSSTGTTYSTSSNHTYSSSGTYQVCLTISYSFTHPMSGAQDNCSTTNCITITVDHPCDLEADFQPLVFDPKVRFVDDSRLINPEAEIVSQLWTINGETFTGNFVDYTFSSPGTYEACLVVTAINRSTGDCCIDSICKEVTITSQPEACALDPGFSFSCYTDDCIFKFSGSSGNSNRNITTWFWNFGDGRTGQGQNIFHTYTNPGTYDVCLTVIGQDGGECCYEEYCRTITFNCNGIDLLSLPNCDPGQGGGSGASSRTKLETIEINNEINMVKVFPNPSTDQVNLEIDVTQEQSVSIELIDISGKRISLVQGLQVKKGKSRTVVNLDHVPAGIYTLSTTGETFYESDKLIIK